MGRRRRLKTAGKKKYRLLRNQEHAFKDTRTASRLSHRPVSHRAGSPLIWPVMESAHYFSASPAGPFTRKPLTVELAGETRKLQTSSGIFSPDGIDKGTAILLAEVPAPAPQGNLLDVGCGWGPIALTMALRAPHAQVYAVDVNERCIALTNGNAELLALNNVTASTPENVDPEIRFDTIWSNPPIRIGKDELHSLLLLWLPRLAPGGSAWLVVQKNLGSDTLQRWLAEVLDDSFTVTRENTSKSFRILRVRKASQ
jgi:16S rRNA (guanine1207-N2)-methyltransferase